MDAFYASIEQRDNPELRGKPVIVGATSPRGVVAAASYEARAYGVRSAMPGFRARELCKDGIFLPSNMALYARVSAEVHEVFEGFTPVIEPLALDEAFLDVTGSVALFGGAEALGRELKRRVRAATELTVSVGIGPNKLVAKIACTLSKPDGLRVVSPSEVRALLDPLPVRRLWGVGPVLARQLHALGIETIGALARHDPAELAGALGDRAAELQRLARGEDDRPVVADREPKSIGEENTFERDVGDRETVAAALTAHADAVARRLRAAGYRGRTVTLKIKLAVARGRRVPRGGNDTDEPDYPLLTRSKTLAEATDDAARIRSTALASWDAANVSVKVRLLGISVSNLEKATEQLELFAPLQRPKLGPALDRIRERFGAQAIRPAVAAPEKVTPSLRKKPGEP